MSTMRLPIGGMKTLLIQQQQQQLSSRLIPPQRQNSQARLYYQFRFGSVSIRPIINQGFYSNGNTFLHQKIISFHHPQKYSSWLAAMPLFHNSIRSPRIYHERILRTTISFSNIATEAEASTAPMLNTSVDQRNTDSNVISASSAALGSTEARTTGPLGVVVVGIGKTSPIRRRRKRRKLSSTTTNHQLLHTASATLPATANTKLTIMKVMKRRRRRRRTQETFTTVNGTKKQYRRLDPQAKWNMHFRNFQKFAQRQQQQLLLQQQKQQRVTNNNNNNKASLRYMLPKDKELRRWLSSVRYEYQKLLQGRKSPLSEARVELLRNCGFSFLVTPMVVSWDARYKQLLLFLNKYDGKYPHELKSTLNSDELDLYQWCNRQRILRKAYYANKLKKNTHITDERIAQLNEINFLWSVNHLHWQERYDELKEYYNTYGNCMVPARWVGNRPLARWVETQRRQYTLLKQNKASQLTPERIQLLEALEFEWDPYEVRWLERYHELMEFQRLNGDGVLPNRATGRALNRWILQQQKAYHQWLAGETSTMNQERKDRLESRGVDWTMPVPKKKKDPISKLKQQLKDMTKH